MDSRSSVLSRLEWRLRTIFSEDSILCDFLEEPYFWSGQGIRGKLCLHVGEMYGLGEDTLLDIASLTEFLHNASLLHDDLIDDDTERRGHPTVWKKYGRHKALLLGDLMIAKSFYLASQIKIDPVLTSLLSAELSQTVASAIRGAVRELDFAAKGKDQIFDSYQQMSAEKTGALFALPVRCIAMVAKLSNDELNALTKIFTNMAVAYQMKDDQADYLGSKLGRLQSSDVLNGRPNLYHLLLSSGQSAEQVFNTVSASHDKLVCAAIKECDCLSVDLRTMLEELLLPFIRLRPDVSTHPQISVIS